MKRQMHKVSRLSNSPRAALSPADAALALVLPQLLSVSQPQTEVSFARETGEKKSFSDPSRAAKHRDKVRWDSKPWIPA